MKANFLTCYNTSPVILTEGAIGERLKREHNINIEGTVGFSDLLYDPVFRKAIKDIYLEYTSIAQKYGLPLMTTTNTRRANKERVALAGYDERIIADNVNFHKEIRNETNTQMYIGGLLGCKGDAYKATEVLSPGEAFTFHSWQANLFAKAEVDFLFAAIMPALPEAIGMAKAMEATGLPYIISFMVKENGKLIDGTTIHDAIETIDHNTARQPLCYMVNCVHPKNLKAALSQPFNRTKLVQDRFRGIQANTAAMSPEDLDESATLITSDAVSLAEDMIALCDIIDLKIFGGCCGTNNTHIEEIARRIKMFKCGGPRA